MKRRKGIKNEARTRNNSSKKFDPQGTRKWEKSGNFKKEVGPFSGSNRRANIGEKGG